MEHCPHDHISCLCWFMSQPVMLFKQKKKPVNFRFIFNGSAKRWGGEEKGACL